MRRCPEPALRTLAAALRFAGGEGEYVLFGSTVLWLHGILGEVGDVDVFVSGRVYREFRRGLGWRQLRPDPDDPPLLERASSPPIHVFHDWSPRDAWLEVGRCFAEAETVGGWRAIPVALVAEHKREAELRNPGSAAHAKHRGDIELIDADGRFGGLNETGRS